MTGYWKRYWEQHASQTAADDPFRQVLRVANKIPMDQEQFRLVSEHIRDLLELDQQSSLLDLCCGNGLLSAALEAHCKDIVAVDFCEDLLARVRERTTHRTSTVQADALAVEFPPGTFDRVVVAAALQHFEPPEVVRLLTRIHGFLRPGGILLITDIPDRDRLWDFFDSPAREEAYFQHQEQGKPILGTWFDRAWMMKLGRYAGFAEASSLDQPSEFLYAHYRFDVRLRRP